MQLIEHFDRGVQLHPRGVAFAFPDGTGALTYAEVDELTHRIAGALRREGLRPGTPVGVLSGNSPIVFPCVLGVLRAGCTWVMLSSKSAPDDLASLLGLVEARALLFSAPMADVARQLRAEVPTLDHLVSIEAPELEAWMAPVGHRVPDLPLDPEAIAGLAGTGGTTGRSKAVEISHRAFGTMIHAFHAHLPERCPVNLVATPMSHAAGAAVFPVLAAGGTNIIHDGVAAEAILTSIEQHRVTRLFLPPTAIYSLLAHGVGARDVSSLRYFLYGAAPMSVDKLEEAMDAFGPVMAQCYGQTELPMLVTFLGPDEHEDARADPARRRRLASCGRASVVARVAILGDDGAPVARGERGEVVVRSPLRMNGYHRDPEQTAAVQRPGGWQATGDIGLMDDDGYLYIVDRTRDLIISGGFNVFPSEVEQVIWGHPAVHDSAVIGVPDEKWGERVTAVVELKADSTVSGAELIALCKERIGSIKAPKDVVFRVLPRSAVGKVLKRELRDEYWVGRERQV